MYKKANIGGYTYNFYLPQETTGNYIIFNDTIQKFQIQGIM